MNSENLSLVAPHHATECAVTAAVANWHDAHHWGGFAMCQEQPCAAVRVAESVA